MRASGTPAPELEEAPEAAHPQVVVAAAASVAAASAAAVAAAVVVGSREYCTSVSVVVGRVRRCCLLLPHTPGRRGRQTASPRSNASAYRLHTLQNIRCSHPNYLRSPQGTGLCCTSGTAASQSDMADHHVPHPASPYKPAAGCHFRTLQSSRCSRPSCLHSPRGMPACCRILSGMSRLDTPPLHAKALSSQRTLVSFHPHHRALNTRRIHPSRRRSPLGLGLAAVAAGSPEYCMPENLPTAMGTQARRVLHPVSPYRPAPGCHRRTLQSSGCSRPSCLHSPRDMPPCCRFLSGMTRLDTPPLHAKPLLSQRTIVSACHRRTLRSSRCSRPSCLHSPRGMPACCRILSGMSRLDTPPLHAKALSSQRTLVSFHPHHRTLNTRRIHPSLRRSPLGLGLAAVAAGSPEYCMPENLPTAMGTQDRRVLHPVSPYRPAPGCHRRTLRSSGCSHPSCLHSPRDMPPCCRFLSAVSP
jgi:hypothetical protein